jgi:hypothetical protein
MKNNYTSCVRIAKFVLSRVTAHWPELFQTRETAGFGTDHLADPVRKATRLLSSAITKRRAFMQENDPSRTQHSLDPESQGK